MNRSELINRISARFNHLTKTDTQLSIDVLLETISNELASGKRIEVRGFGSFQTSIRPPRQARNPMTGEKVHVPEKRVPYFKPGKDLKEGVNRD